MAGDYPGLTGCNDRHTGSLGVLGLVEATVAELHGHFLGKLMQSSESLHKP